MKKHKEPIAELPEEKPEKVKVKRTFSRRFYILLSSGVVSVVGIGLFVLYYFSLNIVMGVGGFVAVVAGVFTFRHYWLQDGGGSIVHLGGQKLDSDVNSMNIYSDRLEFAEVYEPKGFPWQCLNDNKTYFVNIWDEAARKLVPFILPDQQYCDPIVFAQRVLGLPAHKKIFERKPKLMQKLKTALLVVAILIVWLLILTTTGGA